MPMLAVATKSRAPTEKGRRNSLMIFLAMTKTSSGVLMSGSSTVNSSPPWRASVSPERRQPRTRWANSFSRTSPS